MKRLQFVAGGAVLFGIVGALLGSSFGVAGGGGGTEGWKVFGVLGATIGALLGQIVTDRIKK